MADSIDGPTDLYRYYDADDRLLYVGISFSAVARASQHRSDKGWWQDVARMTVEHFATRALADNAETVAIQTEHPIHNVAKRSGPSGVTTTKPVTSDTYEGRVFAFGMPDGTCPVGYVSQYWAADDHHYRPTLEVQLYSWLSGYFGFQTMFIDIQGGMRTLEAECWMDGNERVYEMDPLSAFQTNWTKQHGEAA